MGELGADVGFVVVGLVVARLLNLGDVFGRELANVLVAEAAQVQLAVLLVVGEVGAGRDELAQLRCLELLLSALIHVFLVEFIGDVQRFFVRILSGVLGDVDFPVDQRRLAAGEIIEVEQFSKDEFLGFAVLPLEVLQLLDLLGLELERGHVLFDEGVEVLEAVDAGGAELADDVVGDVAHVLALLSHDLFFFVSVLALGEVGDLQLIFLLRPVAGLLLLVKLPVRLARGMLSSRLRDKPLGACPKFSGSPRRSCQCCAATHG